MAVKVEVFREQIWKYCRLAGISALQWHPPRGHKSTRNLVELAAPAGRRLLYLQESNVAPGFWGVNKNHIKALNDSGARWSLVLLSDGAKSGYLLPALEVNSAIDSGTWSFELENNGYKIHEGKLSKGFAFGDYEEVFPGLLP